MTLHLAGTHACSGKSGCLLTPFEVPEIANDKNETQDLVAHLRESVNLKRVKVTASDAADYVVAIAHESPFISDGVFTQFATLFGRPGVEIQLESGAATEVLTDQGSFFDSEDSTLVAAILFGTGFIFGFTAAQLPTLWLNPHHPQGLDIAVFPLEVSVIRVNSGRLERLESNRGSSEWIPISIY